MKYCKARLHESTSQGRHTTYNYVTLADIVEFHGQTFTQQWQFFASKKRLKYDYEWVTAFLPRDLDISNRAGQEKVLETSIHQ